MKTIIAGGRDFNDYELLKESINKLDIDISEIISGKSKGTDSLGEKFANENSILIREFPANWDSYGRAAGPIRNKEMANYSDVLIAFWDQKSRGTKSMINLAKKQGLTIYVINY